MDPDFCNNWRLAKDAAAQTRAASAAVGDLYFVRAGGAVKIGRTLNVANRLKKIQADNHEELHCLLVLPNRGADEPKWHSRFRPYRIRGEWFRWSGEMEVEIEAARQERLSELAAEQAAA